jgi:hypothetical protein
MAIVMYRLLVGVIDVLSSSCIRWRACNIALDDGGRIGVLAAVLNPPHCLIVETAEPVCEVSAVISLFSIEAIVAT